MGGCFFYALNISYLMAGNKSELLFIPTNLHNQIRQIGIRSGPVIWKSREKSHKKRTAACLEILEALKESVPQAADKAPDVTLNLRRKDYQQIQSNYIIT